MEEKEALLYEVVEKENERSEDFGRRHLYQTLRRDGVCIGPARMWRMFKQIDLAGHVERCRSMPHLIVLRFLQGSWA